jgi:DNA-binding transcriptional ArsR family regulator
MSATSVAVVEDVQRARTLLRGPRVQLLEALRELPDSATGLSERLGMPRQTINYHLRQLEQAGLVELVEERGHGRCVERVVAPAAAAFTLSPATLGSLAPRSGDVDDRGSAEYLAARAGEVVRDVGFLLGGSEAVPTLTLETQIRFASAEDRAAFALDLQEAIERLVAAYHDDRARVGRRFTLLVAAHPEAR